MTDEERRAALYAPKIRDERITPGCHKYKPPVRGLAYRGSVEGMTYKHRDKKLATKCTDGKQVGIHDKSLSGDARDEVVCSQMEAMGGPSNCTTGGGRVAFGKYQTGDNAPNAGAHPSRANRTVGSDGSAPGRPTKAPRASAPSSQRR